MVPLALADVVEAVVDELPLADCALEPWALPPLEGGELPLVEPELAVLVVFVVPEPARADDEPLDDAPELGVLVVFVALELTTADDAPELGVLALFVVLETTEPDDEPLDDALAAFAEDSVVVPVEDAVVVSAEDAVVASGEDTVSPQALSATHRAVPTSNRNKGKFARIVVDRENRGRPRFRLDL